MLVNGSVALLEKDYVMQTLRLNNRYKSVLSGDTLYIPRDWSWYK